MRFYTAEYNGTVGVWASFDGGKTAFDMTCLRHPEIGDMNTLIDTLSAGELSGLKDRAAVEGTPVGALKLLAPIPVPKQDVVCLGINYDEHAKEAGRFSEESFGGERPYTIYFTKHAAFCSADGDPIPSYPGLVDSLDYEAELGVVLSRDTKGVAREEAESCIFGYTIINDVSARNLQTRHKQWLLGKSLDGFTPMGPCIVTPDELGDAANLSIRCTVNGELRQNSNTKYMIQTVAGAIAELSAGMTLRSGTIIATGTPAGVGMGMQPPCFLKPGDTVTCTIEKIGSLTNTVE